MLCLNPCCSGRWSRTKGRSPSNESERLVLILVVVDDGLVPCILSPNHVDLDSVLILVVVDDGLVRK